MAQEQAANVQCDCTTNGKSKQGLGINPSNGQPSLQHQTDVESEPELGPNPKSFSRLCSRDKAERDAALVELTQSIMACLGLDRTGSARIDKNTLVQLLRVSHSCPLLEVREKAAELLQTAQVGFK